VMERSSIISVNPGSQVIYLQSTMKGMGSFMCIFFYET
jgi:hypothetical protein